MPASGRGPVSAALFGARRSSGGGRGPDAGSGPGLPGVTEDDLRIPSRLGPPATIGYAACGRRRLAPSGVAPAFRRGPSAVPQPRRTLAEPPFSATVSLW